MGFRHRARLGVVAGALGLLTACSRVDGSALEKAGLEKRYDTLSGEYDDSRSQAEAVRGWEPTVRARTPSGSTRVRVRSAGSSLGDVVLVAADAERALDARLANRPSNDLPPALGRAVSERGTAGVRRELRSLTGSKGPD